nr:organomercurial lyase MerB [Streptomyces sp. TBY4]
MAARFTDTVNRAPGVKLWLLHPLLTLLAAGEPVAVDQLADRAGRTADEIRQALADMPDTEYDTDGRIIGNGLTQNPTPHRYETGGRTLYTWCALDTLVFPAIIGHTAQVTSPCWATGEPVRLTVTPDGPTHVEPATAVVSLVTPDAPASVRVSFCNQVHFFTSADAAKDWLAEHPGAQVLPVADAFEVGRPVVEKALADGTATATNTTDGDCQRSRCNSPLPSA